MLENLEPRFLLAGFVKFAVIGDFGDATPDAAQVASLVADRNPHFVVTTGDNNYPLGRADTIDANIGQHYHQFIHPYTGSYGTGSPDGVNRFFPALGNHDWATPTLRPHYDYFQLPGNERYYTFRKGPVQFFILDSDRREPDLGFVNENTSTATSRQARWLRRELSRSQAPWNIVVLHHPPYSSSTWHGPHPWMQWPFAKWGASAVIAGHDHHYERIDRRIPYFVNGSGGAELRNTFSTTPMSGSRVRYAADHGAMFVRADAQSITFRFVNTAGTTIDEHTLAK